MNQLLAEYVRATEINLATLGELIFIKSSSKCRIKRQRDICERMLKVCQEYASEIEWHGYTSTEVGRVGHCSRVKKILEAENLVEGLDAHVAELRG